MDERLHELLAINRAIAGSLDYEEVLGLVVEKTLELTAAQACALLLNDEKGVARVAASRGIDPRVAKGFAAPFDERINLSLRQLLSHGPEDTFLGVPVIQRGAIAGLLVIHRPGPEPTDPEEEVLLSALADQAAIALDHASRYRELWRESQRARRDLEIAAERKDQYLAMLAHELRNPLAAIVSALAVLELRLPDDPDLSRSQQAAARQAMHMKRLLDDLLDVSRVTSGRISLEPRPVDITRVVTQAVQSVQPLIDERRHELVIEVPDEPLYVEGDPDRLIQVLSNLLTNAAKYSPPEGQVRLTASASDRHIELKVRDRGDGIPAELLPSIFDLFVQSSRGLDRAGGGLGIGLTLARQLVELHGGEIEAHSEGEGQGAELTVRLPRTPAPSRGNGSSGDADGDGTGDGDGDGIGDDGPSRRILLVEDDPDVAAMLGNLLEQHGHRVTLANDGETALDRFDDADCEVVLIDIGLPGVDGYEVARRIRERGTPTPPMLVAITGYGQENDRRLAREAGFDHHLVKPVEPSELRRVLAGCEATMSHRLPAPAQAVAQRDRAAS